MPPESQPGQIQAQFPDGDEVHLAAGSRTASADLSRMNARLRALLAETAAYRAHFARADRETLM